MMVRIAILCIGFGIVGCGQSANEKRVIAELAEARAELAAKTETPAPEKSVPVASPIDQAVALITAEALTKAASDDSGVVFSFNTIADIPGKPLVRLGKCEQLHALIRTEGPETGLTKINVMTVMGRDSGGKAALDQVSLQARIAAAILPEGNADTALDVYSQAIKVGKAEPKLRVSADVGTYTVSGLFDAKLGMTTVSYTRQVNSTLP